MLYHYVFIGTDIGPPLQCIVPFKKSQQLPLQQRKFNRKLSSLRSMVEHTIGIWKARWSFLRCIPNVGNLSPKQMKQIYR